MIPFYQIVNLLSKTVQQQQKKVTAILPQLFHFEWLLL